MALTPTPKSELQLVTSVLVGSATPTQLMVHCQSLTVTVRFGIFVLLPWGHSTKLNTMRLDIWAFVGKLASEIPTPIDLGTLSASPQYLPPSQKPVYPEEGKLSTQQPHASLSSPSIASLDLCCFLGGNMESRV